MIWRTIQFSNPYAFILLPLVFVIMLIYYMLYRYRREKLAEFGNSQVLKVIVEKRITTHFIVKTVMLLFVWIGVSIALMGPKGNERYVSGDVTHEKSLPQEIRKKMQEVVILIDASASMGIKDGEESKNRFEKAIEVADDLISNLQGENVSVWAFTSAAFQMVPSTTDYLFSRMMLEGLAINEGETNGTDLANAFETLRKESFLKPSSKPKTLILITDGGDTLYETEEGQNKKYREEEILKPMAKISENGVNVYVVGVGKESASVVPNVTYQGKPVKSAIAYQLLTKIAQETHGEYFNVSQTIPLQVSEKIYSLIDQNDSSKVSKTIVSSQTARIYDHYFQIPLGMALIAFVIYLLLPETSSKKEEEIT